VKLQDLDDLNPPVPDAELLASVHARSNARRTRHRRSRALALAAVVLVVGGAAVAWQHSSSTGSRVTVYSGSSGPVKIAGTWKPVSAKGYSGPIDNYRWRVAPSLHFDGHATWSGADGCNNVGGLYNLGPTGAFQISSSGGTTVQCDPPLFPTVDILKSAARVSRRDNVLSFLDAGDKVIATYALVPNRSQATDWAAAARAVRANGSAAYVSQPIDITGVGHYTIVFGPISAADDLRFAQKGASSGLSFADDTPFTGEPNNKIERFVKDGAVYLRMPMVIDSYQAEYDGFRVLLQY
jgi:heat shock protein HslJ